MRSAQMTRNERRMYRRKLMEQRIMGLVMLACAALAFWMCSSGQTIVERDGTGGVIVAALGLWLLFSRKIIIY